MPTLPDGTKLPYPPGMTPEMEAGPMGPQMGPPTADEASIAQILGLGGLNQEMGDLDAQLAQAVALRQPTGEQSTTPIGAGLRGIGDIFRSYNSYRKEKDVRGQREGKSAQIQSGREELYRRAMAERAVERASQEELLKQLTQANALRNQPPPGAQPAQAQPQGPANTLPPWLRPGG